MPQSRPMKLKKTIRRWTGMKEKLMMEAMGQILYPATMMGMVSCPGQRLRSEETPRGNSPFGCWP